MATTLNRSSPAPHQISTPAGTRQIPPALVHAHRLSLRSEFWHRTTPRKVVTSQSSDDPDTAWTVWQRHLASRKTPARPLVLKQETTALLWGISPALNRDEVASWLKPFYDAVAVPRKGAAVACELLDELITSGDQDRPDVTQALRCLAVAYHLPQLSQHVPDSLWWATTDYLYSLAYDALQWTPNGDHDAPAVLVHHLMAGELPIALAYQFPEVRPLRELRKSSAAVLSEAIIEITDGQGLLHCRLLPIMRPLMATWIRMAMLGRQSKKSYWSREAQIQLEWMARQAIRFSRSDGSLVFSDRSQEEWSPGLFAAALDIAGDDADCAAADAVLPAHLVPTDADFDDDDLPDPAVHSEWSGLAVLATRWSKSAPRLAIAYGQQPLKIDLECGRDQILCGHWRFELACDGDQVAIQDEWEEQCWQSDEDCDFLELAVELSHGLRLERHALLGRQDQVLYLADYVIGGDDKRHEFQFSMHLPLSAKMHFCGEAETRDGLLGGDKPRAAVWPLALPEWRSVRQFGEMKEEEGELVLTQRSVGRRLCCPIFFDFRPRRLLKQRTWRQLTVAESLDKVSHDVAVGFRVQSGKDQWLVYRSLAQAANRTVLGQNLSSEFFAGRFLNTGEVDEFIEIESDEE